MPIFMDRHDVSDSVTAEIVAELHQADLKIQHKYNCRGLTYWFDDVRKTAFCLIEAPDKESIHQMHKNAHGEVPHKIIEVDGNIVESFLGRIEDPEKANDTKLNIINDPAFRAIMLVKVLNDNKIISSEVSSIVENYEGRIVKINDEEILSSFTNISKAVTSAINILNLHELNVKIAINVGVPVTEKDSIFEDTIQIINNLTYVEKANLLLSSSANKLFESENNNSSIPYSSFYILNKTDEQFLSKLMNFIEENWNNSNIKIEDINKVLGYSRTQLYRKMNSIVGVTISSFIKNYRLLRAHKLIKERNQNISEIAYQSGFNSPSYFSKCYYSKFGYSPSIQT